MKLNCHIPVVDDLLRVHVFGPADDVPEWAVKKISNPNVWDHDADAAPSEAEPAQKRDLEVPPKAGAGSSADAWRAYAAAAASAAGLNIEIPDDASRGDIIEALEDANLRTE